MMMASECLIELIKQLTILLYISPFPLRLLKGALAGQVIFGETLCVYCGLTLIKPFS
jgi:hypothetical protein